MYMRVTAETADLIYCVLVVTVSSMEWVSDAVLAAIGRRQRVPDIRKHPPSPISLVIWRKGIDLAQPGLLAK